ncbi:hypothetical protein MMC18_002853 [Xylographa bjoerkii]|nr:hypothetical protein [Xylographa bjoerkii]
MPLIIDSSQTSASESGSVNVQIILVIIVFSILFLVIFVVGAGALAGYISRRCSSPLNRKERTTSRHRRIVINSTRTALRRLRTDSVRSPEAAYLPNGTPAPVMAPRPTPLSPMLPPAHFAGGNVLWVPGSPLPMYQEQAFRERLPVYDSLEQRAPLRETRRGRDTHRNVRPPRESRYMGSMLIDPIGISWLITQANDDEDVVDGRFSVSVVDSPWMLNAGDIEESNEGSEEAGDGQRDGQRRRRFRL